MDFVLARDNIKTTLEADASLTAFLQATYSKSITVVKGARKRESSGLDEFPIVYLTDGNESSEPHPAGESLNKIDVLVIAGILQDNPALAIDQIYKFQELIVSALAVDICRGGNAIDTSFTGSVSDFEDSAPRHFRAMNFKLTLTKNY